MRAASRCAPIYLDGYVRVSRVGKRSGPRFISPLVQREAIEAWTASRGFRLLDVFEELDESGMRRDRPLLELAVQRIEEGASVGLAVWRVDRFGRSLSDRLQIIERVRRAGGRFYSVHDGLDIDTEAGRLALRILLSVAEFNLEGLRANWETARRHAIARGVHFSGLPPVGYRRRRSGRLRPDPVSGPIMAEVFRRRAAGDTLRTLAGFLEEKGVPTGAGNAGWSTVTMSTVLRSRVYLGEVFHGNYVNPHAHPPLIDSATWEAAQAPRKLLADNERPSLLAGLVRCASCRYALQVHQVWKHNGKARYANYQCSRFHAGGRCPAPACISALKLEPYVFEVTLRILRNRRHDPAQRLTGAEEAARTAEAALNRYRDNDRIANIVGEQAFLDGLATRQDRLRQARLDVIDARARHVLHHLPSASEIRQHWPGMTVQQQRALLRAVLDAVFVAPGGLPAAQRVTVCAAGTGPRDLPRRGPRGQRQLGSIQPRRGWINPKPQRA